MLEETARKTPTNWSKHHIISGTAKMDCIKRLQILKTVAMTGGNLKKICIINHLYHVREPRTMQSIIKEESGNAIDAYTSILQCMYIEIRKSRSSAKPNNGGMQFVD